MNISLSPSFVLTNESGLPRLVRRVTRESFGPDDMLQLYHDWPWQPARACVQRLARAGHLTEAEQAMVAEFCR